MRLFHWPIDLEQLCDWTEEVMQEYPFSCDVAFGTLSKSSDNEWNCYGTTLLDIYKDDTYDMKVVFFIQEFLNYYNKRLYELFSSNKLIYANRRWLVRVFENLMYPYIKYKMKKKIRVTVRHEFRHTQQFMYIIENGLDIYKYVEEHKSKEYGESLLESDAMKFGDDINYNLPFEKLFENKR